MKKNILVTGCNGDIGTSIGRILKDAYPASTILGIDITSEGPAKFIFDSVAKISKAESENYFPLLSSFVKNNRVDLIIPISESEIRLFFKRNYCEFFENIPVVMTNYKTLEFGCDKLKTSMLLSQLNLPTPWTLPITEMPKSIPCITKNRGLTGKGGVEFVSIDEIEYFQKFRPYNIWQEILQGDEYTCGLYRTRSSIINSIIFKRALLNGNSGFTSSGEVIENSEIKMLLEKIALGLDLRGACNVQLRLTAAGPKVFEINPRFSSTVMFRNTLGFKDVVWACNEAFGLTINSYLPPKNGIRFYKGYSEIFDYSHVTK